MPKFKVGKQVDYMTYVYGEVEASNPQEAMKTVKERLEKGDEFLANSVQKDQLCDDLNHLSSTLYVLDDNDEEIVQEQYD